MDEMDMDLLLSHQRRIRVEEYHRMVDAGIFGEDDRLELLEGVLVEMSPQRPPHAHPITVLNRKLCRELGDAYLVRVQMPLTLPPYSEPEPDLAVVSASVDTWREHPTSAFLVVEAARDSLSRDRLVKGRLYARAAVPDYWLLDVERRRIEVYRDPDPEAECYRSMETVSGDGELRASSLAGVALPARDLFG